MSGPERPFDKYAQHGMLKPLSERKTITTQERVDQFAIPSWEDMEGILELRTHNDPELFTLSIRHRSVLRDFYYARYAIATGEGKKRLEKFGEKYYRREKLMNDLTPHFTLIRDIISPPKTKK